MKMLVVYEKTPQAALNLRLALEMARLTQKAVGDKPEMLVCVMELLREDKPLDDYLAEMENSTGAALAQIDQLLEAAGDNLRSNVRVKVLRGMELEAADLVARQAREWQAALIQLTVDQECASCQQRKHKQPRSGKASLGWFSRLRGKRAAASLESPAPYTTKPVSLNRLLKLTNCRINVTCHGEKLFTLYMHHTEINSRKIG